MPAPHQKDASDRSDSPWVVALTGGVAAGKSAVAACFRKRGISVHDADLAAREVVAPGTATLGAIVETFGPGALDATGKLDRKVMRQRVFGDKTERAKLESIVHPAVHAWLRERVDVDRGPYCMLAIPLLAETWPQYDWVDRVLVVDAPDALRIKRLVTRDDIDESLARRMLASQETRERRLQLADDVIDNSGTLEQLDAAVQTLHLRYLALAGAPRT